MSSDTKIPNQNEEEENNEAADENTNENNEDDDRSAWAWLKVVLEIAVLVARLIRAL